MPSSTSASSSSSASGKNITKLFVGGLSFDTTDAKLRAYFESYGKVCSAVVMRDSVLRRSRGFGFVTFQGTDAAAKVLAKAHHLIDGRRVEAKHAVPRDAMNNNHNGSSDSNHSGSGSSSSSSSSASKKHSKYPMSSGGNRSIASAGKKQPASSGSGAHSSSLGGATSARKRPDGMSSSSSSSAASIAARGASSLARRGSGSKVANGAAAGATALDDRSHRDDRSHSGTRRPVARSGTRSMSSKQTSAGDGSRSSRVKIMPGLKKIFVGGLHYDTNDTTLKAYFEQFGRVDSAQVMYNRETSKSRGFGFVIFHSEGVVAEVVSKRHHVIDSKSVEVKQALPKSEAPPPKSTTGSGTASAVTGQRKQRTVSGQPRRRAEAPVERKPMRNLDVVPSISYAAKAGAGRMKTQAQSSKITHKSTTPPPPRGGLAQDPSKPNGVWANVASPGGRSEDSQSSSGPSRPASNKQQSTIEKQHDKQQQRRRKQQNTYDEHSNSKQQGTHKETRAQPPLLGFGRPGVRSWLEAAGSEGASKNLLHRLAMDTSSGSQKGGDGAFDVDAFARQGFNVDAFAADNYTTQWGARSAQPAFHGGRGRGTATATATATATKAKAANGEGEKDRDTNPDSLTRKLDPSATPREFERADGNANGFSAYPPQFFAAPIGNESGNPPSTTSNLSTLNGDVLDASTGADANSSTSGDAGNSLNKDETNAGTVQNDDASSSTSAPSQQQSPQQSPQQQQQQQQHQQPHPHQLAQHHQNVQQQQPQQHHHIMGQQDHHMQERFYAQPLMAQQHVPMGLNSQAQWGQQSYHNSMLDLQRQFQQLMHQGMTMQNPHMQTHHQASQQHAQMHMDHRMQSQHAPPGMTAAPYAFAPDNSMTGSAGESSASGSNTDSDRQQHNHTLDHGMLDPMHQHHAGNPSMANEHQFYAQQQHAMQSAQDNASRNDGMHHMVPPGMDFNMHGANMGHMGVHMGFHPLAASQFATNRGDMSGGYMPAANGSMLAGVPLQFSGMGNPEVDERGHHIPPYQYQRGHYSGLDKQPIQSQQQPQQQQPSPQQAQQQQQSASPGTDHTTTQTQNSGS